VPVKAGPHRAGPATMLSPDALPATSSATDHGQAGPGFVANVERGAIDSRPPKPRDPPTDAGAEGTAPPCDLLCLRPELRDLRRPMNAAAEMARGDLGVSEVPDATAFVRGAFRPCSNLIAFPFNAGKGQAPRSPGLCANGSPLATSTLLRDRRNPNSSYKFRGFLAAPCRLDRLDKLVRGPAGTPVLALQFPLLLTMGGARYVMNRRPTLSTVPRFTPVTVFLAEADRPRARQAWGRRTGSSVPPREGAPTSPCRPGPAFFPRPPRVEVPGDRAFVYYASGLEAKSSRFVPECVSEPAETRPRGHQLLPVDVFESSR